MKKDKTQIQLLEEIADLLRPISNLSRHYNKMIKEEAEKEKSIALLKVTRTAAQEMKKIKKKHEK
ncbi:MAG: hypothetical protein CMC88_07815 [Flavobacteriaceae bacterium]|nr:hypothetical protein [Flavobacteriaceae bacterium]|tara:strand:+ start:2395 stop:2589 length:195 start_codon:yes stop_codon:yes gene_type:complete